MRIGASFALVILASAACGGAEKPASSAADTSSLEAQHESSDSTSSASTGSTDSTGSSDSSGKASAASSTPAPAASSAPAAAADPPAATVHPTPAATGSIDGKPFVPKIARATAAVRKDGRLLVTITEGTECGANPKPTEGTLSVLLDWKDGYKTDVGSLRRATKPGGGEVGFSRGGAVSKSFKPTGRITVVSAPTDGSTPGKLKVDVQSGDFMLAGDLDVLLCASK